MISKLQANFLRLRNSEYLKLAIIARRKRNQFKLVKRTYKKFFEISEESEST